MRGRTTPRALEAYERQRRAVEMRRAGFTLEQIARSLGYATPTGAWKAILTVVRRNEAAEIAGLRSLELDRLDRMWASVWPDIVQREDADKRNRAVDRLLGITDRRRAILGLDAPTFVNVEAVVREEARRAGVDENEVVREVDAYLREQRRR